MGGALQAYESFAPKLTPQTAAAGLAEQTIPMLGRVVGRFANEHANTPPVVAVLHRFQGMTSEGYETVMRQVAWGDVPARTPRAHAASETADGIFVVAIWESEGAFRFFEPALRTAFAAAGVWRVAPVLGDVHRVGVNPAAGRSASA